MIIVGRRESVLDQEVSELGDHAASVAFDITMLDKSLDGDPEKAERILGRTPMNRFGDVEDIGCAAAVLCSPAAKFITGVLLPVDGGASVGF